MADEGGDSNIDDHNSLSYFMTWALSMTGNRPLTEADNSPQAMQTSITETENDQTTTREPTQDDSLAQDHSKPKEEEKVRAILPEVFPVQSEVENATFVNENPFSDSNTKHRETTARGSVISIAHKAATRAVVPAIEPEVTNKLDTSPEADHKRDLASMTPTQRKLLQRVDPKEFEEHRNSVTKSVATNLSSGQVPIAIKDESYVRPEVMTIEKCNGKLREEGKPTAAEHRKLSGLLDSIHARPQYKAFQTKVPNGALARQHTSLVQQNLAPSITVESEERGPMTYYEHKQKEYYPTVLQKKAMLQNKDPNLSMKSPKKTSAGLDPRAAEYKSMRSAQPLTEEAANEIKQQPEKGPSIIADSGAKEATVTPVADQLNERTAVSVSPSDNGDIADEPTLMESPHPKRTPTESHKSSSQSQDGRRSEKGLDLTPMLNMLGARTLESPSTPGSSDSDDELSVKAELHNDDLEQQTQAPAQKEAIKAGNSRTLILEDLPDNSDYALVQLAIQDAMILKMKLNEEQQCAHVMLARIDDCRRLLELHANGKVIKHRGRMHTIRFKPSSEPEECDNVLDAYLKCGATRDLEVQDVDLDVTMRALFQLSQQGPTQQRIVEAIHDSLSGGVRSVVFRFISVHDAVDFRSFLALSDDWKTKNTKFVQDFGA